MQEKQNCQKVATCKSCICDGEAMHRRIKAHIMNGFDALLEWGTFLYNSSQG